MLSLLDELTTSILSFCNIVDITCFGLTNKRSQGLCISFTNKIAPGHLIKIKDKCRSPLFFAYPKKNEQAIKYLPINYGPMPLLEEDNEIAQDVLKNEHRELVISKTKSIYWESIPITHFDYFLRYRSLDEILLFEERYLPQLLANKEFDFSELRPNPITRSEFYKNNYHTFSNKRRDVLDHFLQITIPKRDYIHFMENPLFITDIIKRSSYKKYGSQLERLINLCSIKHEELVKKELSLCSSFPEHIIKPYCLSIVFTRKNLCLMETVLSFGYKISFNRLSINYNDKSEYYKALNGVFLENLADFILKNIDDASLAKMAELMLYQYLGRFDLEGCIKHRAKFGDSNTMDLLIKYYEKSITIKDIEWLISEGFILPSILSLRILSEHLMPLFIWLYNNGVGIDEGICPNETLVKEFLLIVHHNISERNILDLLIIDYGRLTPSLCKKRIDLLTKYGYTINDKVISLLIKSNVKLPQRKMLLSQMLLFANLEVSNKEVLEIIANNTYSQCKTWVDSHPGILEYYWKMFYPGFGMC